MLYMEIKFVMAHSAGNGDLANDPTQNTKHLPPRAIECILSSRSLHI